MADVWKPNNLMIATTLSAYKYTDGQLVAGYPKVYSIIAAFGAYPAITTDTWQKTSLPSIEVRIEACRTYVSAIEGIDIRNVEVNAPIYAQEAPPEELGFLLSPTSTTINATSGALHLTLSQLMARGT